MRSYSKDKGTDRLMEQLLCSCPCLCFRIDKKRFSCEAAHIGDTLMKWDPITFFDETTTANSQFYRQCSVNVG